MTDTQKYRDLLSIWCPDPAALAVPLPEGHILGWRVVRRDFCSHGGFRWPWHRFVGLIHCDLGPNHDVEDVTDVSA